MGGYGAEYFMNQMDCEAKHHLSSTNLASMIESIQPDEIIRSFLAQPYRMTDLGNVYEFFYYLDDVYVLSIARLQDNRPYRIEIVKQDASDAFATTSISAYPYSLLGEKSYLSLQKAYDDDMIPQSFFCRYFYGVSDAVIHTFLTYVCQHDPLLLVRAMGLEGGTRS